MASTSARIVSGPEAGSYVLLENNQAEVWRPDPGRAGVTIIYRFERVADEAVLIPLRELSDSEYPVDVDGTTYLCRVRASLSPGNAGWECVDPRDGRVYPLGIEGRSSDLETADAESATRAELQFAIRMLPLRRGRGDST